MFLRLNDQFRPIAHDDYSELFDNTTVREYQLDADQYELVCMLDGTRLEEDIVGQYNKRSRLVAQNFLSELERIGALGRRHRPDKRQFPVNIPEPYLEAVLWDVTSLCNLECTHCYVSEYFSGGKGGDLSTDEAGEVIDEMASMNIRDVSLTGGEPLARRDIRSLIERILKGKIRLASIFTNGVLVNQEFVDFLKSLALPKLRIRHSLDGMTPESNAILRGNKMDACQLFKKMVGSIRIFVDADMFISVGTGIHRFNVHDLLHMYSFMKDLGVAQWRMAVPKPIGRFAVTQDAIGADWDDILEAYRKLIDVHLSEIRIEDDKVVAPINIEIEQVFRTELVLKRMNVFRQDDVVCFYHKNRCSLKANGDVVPCGYFDDIVAGNIRNGGLKKAWESQAMQDIKRLRVIDIKGCRGCELLRQCGTGCRALAEKIQGSVDQKDPYACKQALFFWDTVVPLFRKYGFALNMANRCSEFSEFEKV